MMKTSKFWYKLAGAGLLAHLAFSFARGFQPKHFLGKYHPDLNQDADKLAKQAGF